MNMKTKELYALCHDTQFRKAKNLEAVNGQLALVFVPLAKKCLNVRQKLGTRNVMENLKNSKQLLFSCLCSKVAV